MPDFFHRRLGSLFPVLLARKLSYHSVKDKAIATELKALFGRRHHQTRF
jgi:hypothetical protein